MRQLRAAKVSLNKVVAAAPKATAEQVAELQRLVSAVNAQPAFQKWLKKQGHFVVFEAAEAQQILQQLN